MAKHKMSICSDCNGTCEFNTSHRSPCWNCTAGITFDGTSIPDDKIPTMGGVGLEKQCCNDNRNSRITYWKNRLQREKKLTEQLACAKAKVVDTERLLKSL